MKYTRKFQLRLIIFLIFCPAKSTPINNFLDEIQELEMLCPYTLFCNQNASFPRQVEDGQIPCCDSCSCQPDCGYYGTCCFSRSDILYTEDKPIVTCRSAFIVEPPRQVFREMKYYRMVNGCYTTRESCEQPSPYKDHHFNPVFSHSTRMNYINALCARCNDAVEIVPWSRAILCSTSSASILSSSLELVFEENRPSNMSGCYVYFYPPEGIDIHIDHSCDPYLVRECRSDISNFDRYNQLCRMFNATFTVNTPALDVHYANVYCYLCSKGMIAGNRTWVQKTCHYSELLDYLFTAKLSPDFQLTVFLDKNFHRTGMLPTTITDKPTNRCPKNNVYIRSFTKECRSVKCPWGQLRLNNKCDYHSKLWVGGPFTMMLRLVSKHKDAKIPIELFSEMPIETRNDPHAKWLKRKTLRRWRILAFYHPHPNQPYIEYIVLRIKYPELKVNPHHLTKMVRTALKDIWTVAYMNISFEFVTSFNDFRKYKSLFFDNMENTLTFNIDISHNQAFVPWRDFCRSSRLDYQHEVIYPVSILQRRKISMILDSETTITELLLCDQIDLLPGEFDYKCGAVFFKVRNTTIHSFSVFGIIEDTQTWVEDSNKSLGYDFDKSVIRVCQSAFGNFKNSDSIDVLAYSMVFSILAFHTVN